MKKILQLCKYYPPTFGGIELVELMITKAFKKNNDQVYIHAFSDRYQESTGSFQEKIKLIKENIKFLKAPLSYKYFFYFQQEIKKIQPDTIIVHLPNPLMHELIRFNYRFLKKQNIKLIAIYHSDIFNKGILGIFYNLYLKFSLGIYDKIVVSSENLWNSSALLRSIPNDKKSVVPFCIDEEPVLEKVERKDFFIAIGRGVSYKGFDMLIQTFNELKDEKKELYLLTGGENIQKYKDMAGHNVKIFENISHKEKNRLLSEASAMVVSSNTNAEAYGMIIVEAFFYNTPVIASNLSTGVTFLVNEERGAVFPVNNKQELKKIIKNFNHDEYALKALNAKKFYQSELSFEVFSRRMVEV